MSDVVVEVTPPVPAISVVIPLFNKRPYIRRALESVLAQTFGDFEVLVVDDGSTDGGLHMIANINDRRVRILRQSNMGEGPARNAGIQASSASLIAFLDADDAWYPEHLEELRALSAAFPLAVLLATGSQDGTGELLPPRRGQKAVVWHREISYFTTAAKRIGFIQSSCVAIKRSAVRELGGFLNERAGADLEYWARAALFGSVAVSNRITSIYFRDTNGVMQQLSDGSRSVMHTLDRLEDLSPSVRMLGDRLNSDPSLWRRADIRRYLNGRLEAFMFGSLRQSNVTLARSACSFLLPPLTPLQHVLRASVWIPSSVWRLVNKVYSLKNVLDASKRRR